MEIERLIREQIYLVKRRNKRKYIKRNTNITVNNKRLIGLICIILGVVLLMSKCSKGSIDKQNLKDTPNKQSSVNQSKDIQAVNEPMNIRDTYYEYVQDFNIPETVLAQLHQLSIKNKKPFTDILAVWTVKSYEGAKQAEVYRLIKKDRKISFLSDYGFYEDTKKIYSQFIYDLVCFPLPKKVGYTFENGWKQGRSYKGARKHYGIDIMDAKNEPGKLKVYSMTDGKIENIGWNEVGGYRVGIRTNGGAYFYYAHLNKKPVHINKGDSILAGDYIGDMGDTGYGKEGTRGEFPVHLHIGIAVKTRDNEEFWINPYYILRYLELKDFVYNNL
jgi:murein DD-endopeptidase MepM/ murein hydrolase activator NlpD